LKTVFSKEYVILYFKNTFSKYFYFVFSKYYLNTILFCIMKILLKSILPITGCNSENFLHYLVRCVPLFLPAGEVTACEGLRSLKVVSRLEVRKGLEASKTPHPVLCCCNLR